jgi:hypothetical protein
MNPGKKFLFLITGLIILIVPVIFINYLSDQIYNRSLEVSINLLREKILLELENFKNRLKPEAYVQHIIEKTHRKLLAEIPPDLTRMYADHDFAFDLFDSELPQSFSSELKKNGLSP